MLERGFQAEDLQTYLRWVFTSDEKWPKWMRKDEGKDYCDTANLFRISHLQEHLQEALAWARGGEEDGPVWVAVYGDRSYSG